MPKKKNPIDQVPLDLFISQLRRQLVVSMEQMRQEVKEAGAEDHTVPVFMLDEVTVDLQATADQKVLGEIEAGGEIKAKGLLKVVLGGLEPALKAGVKGQTTRTNTDTIGITLKMVPRLATWDDGLKIVDFVFLRDKG